MKVLLCQISSKLINPSVRKSYSSIYSDVWYTQHEEDGYVRPEHFWEIPMWIAEVSYCFKDKELHIVEDVQKSAEYINNSDADIVLFSCLDVNKPIINRLCFLLDKPIGVGGYNRLENEKIVWFESVQELCKHFGVEYRKGTDYSLFKGVKTIPRLQLSQGCRHKCKFCTIPKEIIENDFLEIRQQVLSFRDTLNFKLVYIDDKTFGQASNYRILKWAYRKIKQFNPSFKGFIVQTTATQVSKIDFEDLHVFAVELGVESFNDFILESINKPVRTKHVQQAVDILHNYNINVIFNIIVGLPNETRETYINTLNFIVRNNPYGLNIYNLCLYKDSVLTKELGIEDKVANENKVVKAYNTLKQNRLNKWFSESLYLMGLDNMFYKDKLEDEEE